jgi:hypothetical protein
MYGIKMYPLVVPVFRIQFIACLKLKQALAGKLESIGLTATIEKENLL